MIKSRWFRFGAVLPLVGAMAVFAGCSGEATPTSAPASEDVAKAPQAAEAPKGAAAADKGGERDGKREGMHGRRGGKHAFGHGPAHMLGVALHELELSDAQKTKIEGALEALRDDGPDHKKDPAAWKALADSVRAGKVDEAALNATLAKKAEGAEEHRAKMAEALSTLHATLTKEQRRALVDAMTAKVDRKGDKGERGPKGDGDGKERRGPKGDGEGWGGKGRHGMRGGPMGHMLADLDLTDEQRAQIDKALEGVRPDADDIEEMKEGFEAMMAERKARLETFAADSFDAKAFLAQDMKDMKGKGMKGHHEVMVSSLKAVLPILTEAQRTKLADQLEKGPMMGMGKGPMGKPGRDGKRGGESR